MLTLTILASVGGVGWWLFQRRQPSAPVTAANPPQPAIRRPTRVLAPLAQAARLSPVWQLHSNGCQCAQARAHAGRRLPLEEVQPLLQGGQPCRCSYRPIADQRRGPRRVAEDRRAALRFDLKKVDRRQSDRRRAGSAWERTLGF